MALASLAVSDDALYLERISLTWAFCSAVKGWGVLFPTFAGVFFGIRRQRLCVSFGPFAGQSRLPASFLAEISTLDVPFAGEVDPGHQKGDCWCRLPATLQVGEDECRRFVSAVRV